MEINIVKQGNSYMICLTGGRKKEVEEHNFDTMYEEYCQMFNTIPHEMFDNEQDAMDFLARGYTTIKNWIEEEKEKPRPLYTEKQHFVTLDEALPKIRVTIDRINGNPDDVSNWEVEDYKTGKVYSSTMLYAITYLCIGNTKRIWSVAENA